MFLFLCPPYRALISIEFDNIVEPISPLNALILWRMSLSVVLKYSPR
ncbi:hypothetical protein VCRA2119O147_3920002 [Vibrio crassostreae]|nr:hypothetical protein VCRA2118O239_10194 [Vibrio crassostreae]CAK1871857.1 hypothetical protein VCRA2113O213_10452 [Vibrio crassostreae]CAK1877505.1 hypothetical protein VCRA2113O140_10443 [Vibrio crassostreae]CAK1885416.1 hypothetical protein VCRA2113O194_10450 [Vibrio crassostreae]CAK1995151.1 hypothetical protein VCRA2113O137_20084 [Vibrio crassostreae]